MRQLDRQVQILAHRNRERLRRIGIQRNCHIDRGACSGRRLPLILDAEFETGLFAHDGKGRRIGDDQPPVPIRLVPGQQNLQRSRQHRHRPHVMHLPIGDDQGACNPGQRHFGQRPGQRRHCQCPGIVLAIGHMNHAQFGVGQDGDLGLDRLDGLRRLKAAVRQALACTVIHHQHHDIRQRLALLILKRGVAQRHQHQTQSQRPQRPARQPAPHRKGQQNSRRHGQRDQKPIRHQRLKEQGLAHWPSLSSRAGTCT